MALVSVLVLVLHSEVFFFAMPLTRSRPRQWCSDTAAVTIAAVTIAAVTTAAVTIAAVTVASTSMNPVLRFD